MEYRLARNAVIREFRKGRLSRLDVCDAHPELLRAARHLGRPSGEQCPICEDARAGRGDVRLRLPAPPRRAVRGHPAELARYWRRKDPVVCYVIEVCTGAAWNHLARMYPAGAGVEAVARKPLRGRASL